MGFTVDTRVPKRDAVGRIGADVVVDGVKGSWTVDQWTSSYVVSNGHFLRDRNGRLAQGGEAIRDITMLTPAHRGRQHNNFSVWDHPGTTGSTAGVYGNWSFFVKVYSGSDYCQAQFHIIQRDGAFHWDKGP